MTLPVALGTYFIIWWLVLFAVLPIGVRTPGEGDELAPGHAESAPVQAHILLKFLATTIIAAIVFVVVYLVIVYRLIPVERFPTSLG